MLSCSKEIKDILLRLCWYFVDAIKLAIQGQRDLYKSRKGSPILKWTIFPRVFLISNELKKNFMKHQIYLRPFERETSPLRPTSDKPYLKSMNCNEIVQITFPQSLWFVYNSTYILNQPGTKIKPCASWSRVFPRFPALRALKPAYC